MSDPLHNPTDEPPSNAAAIEEPIVLSHAARQELEQFRRDHETKVLTIFFSDLIGSTQLQVDLGNLRAAQLVQRHYGVMRRILAQFEGREISTAGDSMLIVFAAPSEGVKFALYAQQAMCRDQKQDEHLPTMRCGLHQGQVMLQKESGAAEVTDIYGVQVSMAARIMSLGQSRQILMSRAVFDDARTVLIHDDFAGLGELAWTNHGAYRFKGIREECDVCEVGELGVTPGAPPASSKAWPARSSGPIDGPSSGRSSRRRHIVPAAAVVLLLGAIGLYAAVNGPWRLSAADAAAREARKNRLAQAELSLARISGIDDEMPGLNELEKKYRHATGVFFGNEPAVVRDETLKFLARLRTYELTEAEQALVVKADALSTATFYPEEVYHAVRQLAEMLAARKKALAIECEQLRADKN